VDASKPRRVEYHEANQLAMRYKLGLKFEEYLLFETLVDNCLAQIWTYENSQCMVQIRIGTKKH
jgi:hypothetical protein